MECCSTFQSMSYTFHQYLLTYRLCCQFSYSTHLKIFQWVSYQKKTTVTAWKQIKIVWIKGPHPYHISVVKTCKSLWHETWEQHEESRFHPYTFTKHNVSSSSCMIFQTFALPPYFTNQPVTLDENIIMYFCSIPISEVERTFTCYAWRIQ